MLTLHQMLIGDSILAWRVAVLYQRTLWVVAVLCLALLVGYGAQSVGSLISSLPHLPTGMGLTAVSCMIGASMGHPFSSITGCTDIVYRGQEAAWSVSLFVNIFATIQLGRIAWCATPHAMDNFEPTSHTTVP